MVSMQITILGIGKTNLKECAALEAEYGKRIRGRFSFTTKNVKNEKEFIAEVRDHKGVVVLMDENGSVMNSREFAGFLENRLKTGEHILFVIGDAAGLPQELRDIPADMMALSEMTFPHDIARVLLTEQIYRAQTILEGHPYHK